jgi:hypothetical protein
MPKFLSDEWFARVEELNAEAGDPEITPAMKAVVVNLDVGSGDDVVEMCMDRGLMKKGHAQKADVRMSMPADYAYSILVAGDWSAGMKGWMARKIKLNGNIKKLIPLQVHTPTGDQEALREKIRDSTDPVD